MSTDEKNSNQSHSTLIARFMWALVGPLILLGLLAGMTKSTQSFSLWEAGYILTVALMIGGRYIEQRSGHATTLYSEPSTPSHFKNYTVRLIVFAGVLAFLAKAMVKM